MRQRTPDQNQTPSDTPPPNPRTGDVVRLLLIEDDDQDATLLAQTIRKIESQAFQIERASTLEEAQAFLLAKEFDAILLDLSLPDATGFQSIERIVGACAGLPIIVLTGHEHAAVGPVLIRMGAQDYLPKSELTRDTIWRSISHAVERASLSQALFQAESRALSASSAKSAFAEAVSHEFRTPLHAILGTADLLAETRLDDQQAEYVEALQRSGQTLLSLINNVLDLSAIKGDELFPSALAEGEVSRECGQGLRILLVDDSEDNRMLAQAYLGELGAEFDLAVNGAEAIRRFNDSGPYSVILMDMQMPLVDGYEASREIRRLEKQSGRIRTPIIALTADAFPEQKEEAMRAGCDEHLSKPITREGLVPRVTAWAGHSGRGSHESLVDPLVADLVPGFVARRLEDMESLDTALEERGFEEIRRIAHKMKGSGLSFGFPLISELGAELEKAAIAQDRKEIRRGIEQIREQLEGFEHAAAAD